MVVRIFKMICTPTISSFQTEHKKTADPYRKSLLYDLLPFNGVCSPSFRLGCGLGFTYSLRLFVLGLTSTVSRAKHSKFNIHDIQGIRTRSGPFSAHSSETYCRVRGSVVRDPQIARKRLERVSNADFYAL